MRVHSLSAVIFASADPDRLAAFYNEHLGLGFARRAHGPTADHHEARIGDMRFAILPGRTSQARARDVSPTFLVNGLDDFRAALTGAGVEERAPVRSLGERKRLASYSDIDGNNFQLIDLDQSNRSNQAAGRRPGPVSSRRRCSFFWRQDRHRSSAPRHPVDHGRGAAEP